MLQNTIAAKYDSVLANAKRDGVTVNEAPVITRLTKHKGTCRFAVIYGKPYYLPEVHDNRGDLYPAILENGNVFYIVSDEPENTGGVFMVCKKADGRSTVFPFDVSALKFHRDTHQYTVDEIIEKIDVSKDFIHSCIQRYHIGTERNGVWYFTKSEFMVIAQHKGR